MFTGNLKGMKRQDAINLVESYGAKVSSSVSSKTDYLISGAKTGNKLQKAKKNQVTILMEDEFYTLIESVLK